MYVVKPDIPSRGACLCKLLTKVISKLITFGLLFAIARQNSPFFGGPPANTPSCHSAEVKETTTLSAQEYSTEPPVEEVTAQANCPDFVRLWLDGYARAFAERSGKQVGDIPTTLRPNISAKWLRLLRRDRHVPQIVPALVIRVCPSVACDSDEQCIENKAAPFCLCGCCLPAVMASDKFAD